MPQGRGEMRGELDPLLGLDQPAQDRHALAPAAFRLGGLFQRLQRIAVIGEGNGEIAGQPCPLLHLDETAKDRHALPLALLRLRRPVRAPGAAGHDGPAPRRDGWSARPASPAPPAGGRSRHSPFGIARPRAAGRGLAGLRRDGPARRRDKGQTRRASRPRPAGGRSPHSCAGTPPPPAGGRAPAAAGRDCPAPSPGRRQARPRFSVSTSRRRIATVSRWSGSASACLLIACRSRP